MSISDPALVPPASDPLKPSAVPPATGTLGLALFLASLAVLFISAIGGYAIIRLTGQLRPAWGSIQLPWLLWISTSLVIVSSITIQHALASVRHGSQQHFRISLSVTFALAILFVILQTPALIDLLNQHHRLLGERIHIYGLVFCLILLHAAHVLGGLIPMAVVWFKAFRGHYSDVYFRPILHLTMYWHFLDAVWFIMFCVFLLLA